MTVHVDQFHAALLVLAGNGHVKQRLVKAFEDHISHVPDDDLPVPLRESLADLKREVHRVSPLNGEGPIRASVRKMSLKEAGECAGRVGSLYADVLRLGDDVQSPLPLDTKGEERVPPFLVKSV